MENAGRESREGILEKNPETLGKSSLWMQWEKPFISSCLFLVIKQGLLLGAVLG